ncbi:MAG: MoaD/ThiS family protein [Gammaproteobacteria bacterium]|nr:MoaD/ThiS family protein [Gammaproteobacteria bacterium]
MEVNLAGSIADTTDGAASIEIEAATIRELLRKLVERYPRLQSRIDEGVAVCINGEIYRDNRDVAIPEGAEVVLLPRIQGG